MFLRVFPCDPVRKDVRYSTNENDLGVDLRLFVVLEGCYLRVGTHVANKQEVTAWYIDRRPWK